MSESKSPGSQLDADHGNGNGTLNAQLLAGTLDYQEETTIISHVDCGVSVVDWSYPEGGDVPIHEEKEFLDAQSFSDFLSQKPAKTIVSRLIHIRSASWALPIVMRWSGHSYGTFPDWMSTPSMATTPGEHVWHSLLEGNYLELKFGYEYFSMHPRNAHDKPPCDARNHLTRLRTNQNQTDTQQRVAAAAAAPSQFHVCLQKIGVICFWGAVAAEKAAFTPATAVVVQNLGTCPPDWRFPLDVNWRRERRLGAREFSRRFIEHVLHWSVRGSVQRWFRIIRSSQLHYALFEKEIFSDPENEAWGEELWEFSRNWNVYNRLISLHMRLVDYLEPKAQRFLHLYWERRSVLEENSGLSRHVSESSHHHHVGDIKLFGRLPSSFVANQTELVQGLVNPTMNMLDMIYKRVAIRDARHSLMLNESLWRLSWITFIFLPLTFMTGVFGMNVDLLADNPSIKWWFVVAIPLMVLVFLAWFLFRRSYAAVNQAALRRGRRELDGLRQNI